MGLLVAILVFMQLLLIPVSEDRRRHMAANRKITYHLLLTDPALWTEARYTRNPSQADFFTPFQDFPGSLEHFPAGSIVVPPASHQLWRGNESELEKYVQTIENS